jgi:prephenate dehydrogenase
VLDSVQEVVRGCELVVLAVPPAALPDVIADVAAWAHAGLLLSDVTSVKGPVRELARAHHLRYVGGHPMAGNEHSGWAASDPRLLAGAAWVLCLEEDTDLDDWLRLARLVTGLGALAVPCTAADHDRAVAAVSHLPHLLAAALATTAADDPLALALAAGSFRDGTRVAAAPPALSAAMCAGNAAAVSAALRAAMARLEEADGLLAAGADLTEWFAAGQAARSAWPPPAGPESLLPVGPQLRERLLALGRRGGAVAAVDHDVLTVRG